MSDEYKGSGRIRDEHKGANQSTGRVSPRDQAAAFNRGRGLPRTMRVDCSQFASCQWHGKRLVAKLGVQPDPCPKCGKEVVA